MLRTGPATVELLRPVGPDVPSDERVLEVLDGQYFTSLHPRPVVTPRVVPPHLPRTV
jgi:hypothetical protein